MGANAVLEMELDRTAVTYVRSCLAAGHRLARALQALPLEAGRTTAFVPANTPPERTSRFAVGGVTSRTSTEPRLVDLIASALAAGAERCAVFEDAVARPSDPALTRSSTPYFRCGEEVYHLLTGGDATPPAILSAVRRATSYSFIGTVTSIPPGATPHRGDDVPASFLEELAPKTALLLVGAWDQEGAIIWTPRS